MRPLRRIILHYTATPSGVDFNTEDVRTWHIKRGFADIGYHFLVRLGGDVERGRPVDIAGAHAKGHNADSIGVCYVGGGEGEDTRTPEQKAAIARIIDSLRTVFGPMPVLGHRELPGAATLCPGFTASMEYN